MFPQVQSCSLAVLEFTRSTITWSFDLFPRQSYWLTPSHPPIIAQIFSFSMNPALALVFPVCYDNVHSQSTSVYYLPCSPPLLTHYIVYLFIMFLCVYLPCRDRIFVCFACSDSVSTRRSAEQRKNSTVKGKFSRSKKKEH